MLLQALRKKNAAIRHNDITIHVLSVKYGRNYCSAIGVYGNISGFSSKVGNYCITQVNRLIDITDSSYDPPMNTFMYSAGAMSRHKQSKFGYNLLKAYQEHYVDSFFDDNTRDTVYVLTKKIDDFASRGLSVVQKNRKNNQKSGPSKKGSGAI
jgi:hypothetical protein